MRNYFWLLIFTLSFSTLAQETKSVLFLGNSYIASNNLPFLIKSLADAENNTLEYDENTPGGTTFQGHDNSAVSIAKIQSKDWDFVVLQGQSQEPSFPDHYVESSTFPYALNLANKVYANNECSVPLFFNTWGRQNGDPQWEGINTFEKMNGRLYNAYAYLAAESKGMLSPVGIAFALVKADANAVVNFNHLYTSDGSHPSIKGSYLAACVFNNVIFGTSSVGNSFVPVGVSSVEAAYLQSVADEVVYGLEEIRIDYCKLSENSFNYQIDGETVSFEALLESGDVVSWDFGDGSTSTEINPSHSYSSVGTYTVTLTTKDACFVEDKQLLVEVETLGLASFTTTSFVVYPNPSTTGTVTLQGTNGAEYKVFSIQGELMYKGVAKELNLPSGNYLIQLGTKVEKLIVL